VHGFLAARWTCATILTALTREENRSGERLQKNT
jgi:hypothetical protein